MDNVFLILKGCNCLLLLGVWLYSFKNYKNLPSKIPIHFNIEGEVDGYGNKKYFFLLPAVSTFLFALFFYVSNSPETANYPVELTKENYIFQQALGMIFCQFLLTICLLLFILIQKYTVGYVAGKNPKMAYFALCIVAIFLTIIGYCILSNLYK